MPLITDFAQGLLGGIGDIIGKFKADPTKIAELEYGLRSLVLEQQAKAEAEQTARQSLEVDDRKSAREREAGLRNSLGVIVQNAMAVLLILAFTVEIFLILAGKVQVGEGLRDILMVLIGMQASKVNDVFSYWYGTSAGSARHGDALRELLTRKP